jgi:hypothetical protein
MTRTLMADYAELVRQSDCEGFGESGHFVQPAHAKAA